MEVEIWSDVMCPFCYIGKRKFEEGLNQFGHKEEVKVVWKSFQLNPAQKTEPGKNINQYLADVKGWSVEQAKQMNDRVTDMAREVGLDYHFDKASWPTHGMPTDWFNWPNNMAWAMRPKNVCSGLISRRDATPPIMRP